VSSAGGGRATTIEVDIGDSTYTNQLLYRSQQKCEYCGCQVGDDVLERNCRNCAAPLTKRDLC